MRQSRDVHHYSTTTCTCKYAVKYLSYQRIPTAAKAVAIAAKEKGKGTISDSAGSYHFVVKVISLGRHFFVIFCCRTCTEMQCYLYLACKSVNGVQNIWS